MRVNLALSLACLGLLFASTARAQQTEQLNAEVVSNAGLAYPTPATPAVAAALSAADPADPEPPQGGTAPTAAGADGQWHLSISPYLWLPGVHGTIGALGHEAGFRASATDLLSHFRFGLLGLAEARHNRLLTTIDLMFMRLGDDKAVAFPGFGAQSANLTANMFLLTPKLGVRLVNGKMIKVDALAGIRYWHFHENVNFTPVAPNLNFSKSQSFVDPVVGGRIITALSRKAEFTVAGDVGGWGTGSQLEYQIVGLLGYKLKPNMTAQAGYRYLYVDYQKGGPLGTVITTAMSGVVLGVTLNLK
jgi:hypothetical protein